ncbi:antistasin-like [Liolophura sinensis]|uniref:antistasin-like n=1 Tax=Liolophura sinensis TaxID=3198878 RepID=UPI0031581C13
MWKLMLTFVVLIAMTAATSPPVQCPPICFMWCSTGNVRDQNGCELCMCRPAPNDDFSVCPPQCRMGCAYGFVRDENNCDICQCRDPPPGGYQYQQK